MKSNEYIQWLTKDITPSMAYRDEVDYGVWQKEAKGKLAELLGLPFIKCDQDFCLIKEEECKDYKRVSFRFQSEPGYYVPCTILIPIGIEGLVPGVICMQGHSSGAHISLGIAKFQGDEKTIAGGRDFAVRAVKEGFCAIVIEQRYMGEKGQTEEGSPACLRKNAAMSTLLLGRTAIGERVWDVQRLIDVIETYFSDKVDMSRLMCMGNSGGGTTTFYASALDERIKLSIPSCAVCTYDDSIMAMKHCECNYVPNIRRFFNMGDIGCLIAPRPLVVVCGKEDPIFPLHGVEASFEIIQKAYRKMHKEEDCHLVIGDGGHQFYPDDVWPIVKRVLRHEI